MADVASTVLGLFAQLHAQVRVEVKGLDDDALNWSPGADANSIATIVIHLVGSEAETLRAVAGVPGARDREAELAPATRSPAEVLGALAWLVGNYGHAREHVGHIQLTKQLYVTPSAANQLARDQSGTE